MLRDIPAVGPEVTDGIKLKKESYRAWLACGASLGMDALHPEYVMILHAVELSHLTCVCKIELMTGTAHLLLFLTRGYKEGKSGKVYICYGTGEEGMAVSRMSNLGKSNGFALVMEHWTCFIFLRACCSECGSLPNLSTSFVDLEMA